MMVDLIDISNDVWSDVGSKTRVKGKRARFKKKVLCLYLCVLYVRRGCVYMERERKREKEREKEKEREYVIVVMFCSCDCGYVLFV